MLNFEVFDKETQPTETEIKNFIGTELFTDSHNYKVSDGERYVCYKM